MASIKSTIELYDSFSSPLMDIVNAVNSSIPVMDRMQTTMNRPIDISSMNIVQSQIDEMTEAARQFEAAMQDVSSPSVSVQQPQSYPLKEITVPVTAVVERVNIDTPENVSVAVTPYVTEQVNIDTPENISVTVEVNEIGISESEQKIEELTSRLNEVSQMQNAIGNIAKSVYILPEDTSENISSVSREINRLKPALEFLKSNPFNLDSSIAKLQIQTISESLDAVIEKQRQVNNYMGNAAAQKINLTVNPVEVPITWKSDNLEVFTNTGVERFQQEISSVNSMMEELSAFQNEISQQAESVDIIPPEAITDIQGLHSRIQELQTAIAQLEQNPLSMGSEEESAKIERLRMQLNQTLNCQENLKNSMQGMDIGNINDAYLKLSQNVSNAERTIRDSFSQPIEVPITWKSDDLEVFTNTGVERFQQEIQSTNNLLNTLNQTQSRISSAAAQTNLFPAGAAADINNMSIRLQAIQQRIQAIENNPLNIGFDTANAELERLRGQLNQAVSQQESLNRAVENMDVEAANEAYLRLSQTIGNTERYIRDNVNEQGNFNRTIEQGCNEANQLMGTIKKAAAAYVSVQGITSVLNISDELTQNSARLDLMNDGLQTTKDLQNMIYLSAERSRGSYQATAAAVSKLGLLAGDAFSSSQEIIDFTEQLNKQFTIAGTEAAGIDAAMLQLTQAMGSGVLRGEEYNSVLEQAPNIIQSIADYMDVPMGQLKDMASEGAITSEIIKNAMFAAANSTNAKFESMPKTFSQIWTSFKNSALTAFQPVLERINEIANSEAFQEFADNAIEAFSTVAGIALEIFDLLVEIADIIADNWSWLSPIILGVAEALAVYYGAMLLYNTITGISTAITEAKAFAEKAHAASLAIETGATFAATAAQYGFNAALYACPIVWIIGGFILLVAAVYAVSAAIAKSTGAAKSGLGLICGCINVTNQFFSNLGKSIANIAGGIWEAINALCYNMITAFGNAINTVQSKFYTLLSTAMDVIASICEALNKLPFIEFDFSGITSKAEEYASNAAKIAGRQTDYESIGDAFDKGYSKYTAFKDGWVSEAFDAGVTRGDSIYEKIKDKIIGAFGYEGDEPYGPPEDPFRKIRDLDDYLSDYLPEDIGSGIDDIAGNTDSIADLMDITEEDLKYLRDIAEQETVNRFTTAEITIEQTNNNNISSDMNLDGVVSGLTDAVHEAVVIIAEGVHE